MDSLFLTSSLTHTLSLSPPLNPPTRHHKPAGGESKGVGPLTRVADPVCYSPDPDSTSQEKLDPDPDPDTSILKIFHLYYDEF